MQKDVYNRGGYIAFLFSMAFSLAFFAYISFFHKGVDLKEVKVQEPVETTLAEGSDAPKAVDVSKIEKPWLDNEDMVTHGSKVYSTNCAVCHGPKGEGDGPAGKALNPPPRNFVEGKWTVGGDSISLYKTIKDGLPSTSMASFAHLPVVDRWALVQFIHSVTKNRIKDDPKKLEAFATSAK